MHRVRRVYRTPVGAAISRPKSFDFAGVFYKSYRITVPIILGRLIAAPTLVGTKPSDKLGFIDLSWSESKKDRHPRKRMSILVRVMRLERTRLLPHAPQTCLSTDSSTLAFALFSAIIQRNLRFVNTFFSSCKNLFFLLIYSYLIIRNRRSCYGSFLCRSSRDQCFFYGPYR